MVICEYNADDSHPKISDDDDNDDDGDDKDDDDNDDNDNDDDLLLGLSFSGQLHRAHHLKERNVKKDIVHCHHFDFH